MKKACEALDYAAARVAQERARATGRLVGIGIASYVALTGIGTGTPAALGMPVPAGTEAATIRVDPWGGVTAIFGAASHAQALETALAQVVADELDVSLEDVRVRFGDTALTRYGAGSYARRRLKTPAPSMPPSRNRFVIGTRTRCIATPWCGNFYGAWREPAHRINCPRQVTTSPSPRATNRTNPSSDTLPFSNQGPNSP